MAEFALSTNLFSYALVTQGLFGWPAETGEGEVIRALVPGDIVIPKFAASATWGSDEAETESQRAYCESMGADYDTTVKEYLSGAAGGVPFLLRVRGSADDRELIPGEVWALVEIERLDLDKRLDTRDLLRLRAFPPSISAQFKGSVSPGRHLQEVPTGTADAVRAAANAEDPSDFLRKYSVVEATSVEEAADRLAANGRTPQEGDRCFVASAGGLLGVCDGRNDGTLHAIGEPIPKTPDELVELFTEASTKATEQDRFSPSRAIDAARELNGLLDGPQVVVPIDDFGRFYDRYMLLAGKITQALAINARASALPPDGSAADGEEAQDVELDELSALQGLTVAAVREQLPPEMALADAVLAEAVTALRAGKHLLLGGPPGTGKSTLAEALCRAVVGAQYEVTTATADWTTFDTIGGYMPKPGGELEFSPGVVLRCLRRGRWLTIDELNRADIDKAFGPLFTLLAGAGASEPNRSTMLPFQTRAGKNIEIRWAKKRSSGSDFVVTPGWRLIGTLNLSDKATLFQLSFAFLRRFAVIDVPLPPESQYRSLFSALCAEIDASERENIVSAGMRLAFGARELGPAILRDVAGFLAQALAPTSSGSPTYGSPVEAFATAMRLFAVPQYEGATKTETEQFLSVFADTWPSLPAGTWDHLKSALEAVALA